jgi:hypothetical protein
MTFWKRLLGGGEPSNAAEAAPAVPKPAQEFDRSGVPYSVDLRPMPQGDDVETLLPKSVGDYRRGELDVPAEILHNSIDAEYRAGKSVIQVALGICGDRNGALQALAIAKRETDAEFPNDPQVYSDRDDPSFLLTTNRRGAFMAWTRGRYFFSAHARGGSGDLENFMAAFPY